MKILITGGTGLIGRHFISTYPHHRYIVLTRQRPAPLAADNVTYINNLDAIDNLDGFDAVINLAGEPIVGRRWSNRIKGVIESSRFGTTEALVALMAASAQPPAVFISGSAIGVYGDTGTHSLGEADPINVHDSGFSQSLVRRWEQIATAGCPAKTRLVLLRTGIVLAANGGALAKMTPAYRFGLGGPMGSGKQGMSWIHIDDMVAVIEQALTDARFIGPINLVAPEPTTNAGFSSTLGAVMRRPSWLPLPGWLLTLLLGEAAELLLDSQFIRSDRLKELEYTFKFGGLAEALTDCLVKT